MLITCVSYCLYLKDLAGEMDRIPNHNRVVGLETGREVGSCIETLWPCQTSDNSEGVEIIFNKSKRHGDAVENHAAGVMRG